MWKREKAPAKIKRVKMCVVIVRTEKIKIKMERV